MTDRELLELAAKAAELKHIKPPMEYSGAIGLALANPHGVYAGDWDPLNDDGDALRLAVKLKIPLQFPDWDDVARAWGPKRAEEPCDEMFSGDPERATRRAIVRAAAEIGKEMR